MSGQVIEGTVYKSSPSQPTGITFYEEFSNNGQINIRIYQILPQSLFHVTQLKENMLVIAVNGKPCTNMRLNEVTSTLEHALGYVSVKCLMDDQQQQPPSQQQVATAVVVDAYPIHPKIDNVGNNVPIATAIPIGGMPVQQQQQQQQTIPGKTPWVRPPPPGVPPGGEWGYIGSQNAAKQLIPDLFGDSKKKEGYLLNGQVYDTKGKCLGSLHEAKWKSAKPKRTGIF
jgi:hypothetical protein